MPIFEQKNMRLLTALTLCIAGTSYGQITLTNADFADGGDTVRISTTTDPAIDYASTGTNFTWDFSGLVAETQTLRDYKSMAVASSFMTFIFGSFAPIAYQATNFTSTDAIPLDLLGPLLPVNISDMALVSKNTSSEINSIGYSLTIEGTEVPVKSDDIETRYELPVDYGNVYSSTGFTDLDMNPIQDIHWIQHRQRSSNVDGWGSITTPYGTFDALRIRHDIIEEDSLYFGFVGTWIGVPVPPSVIYEWWTNGEMEPILRITVTNIVGTDAVTGIEYRDEYLGLDAGIEEQTIAIGIFPNPAQETITFEGVSTGSSYSIVNAEGKTVHSGVITSATNEIDIHAFANGTYHVIIRSEIGAWGSAIFVKK
jgi:hypothetical protein